MLGAISALDGSVSLAKHAGRQPTDRQGSESSLGPSFSLKDVEPLIGLAERLSDTVQRLPRGMTTVEGDAMRPHTQTNGAYLTGRPVTPFLVSLGLASSRNSGWDCCLGRKLSNFRRSPLSSSAKG